MANQQCSIEMNDAQLNKEFDSLSSQAANRLLLETLAPSLAAAPAARENNGKSYLTDLEITPPEAKRLNVQNLGAAASVSRVLIEGGVVHESNGNGQSLADQLRANGFSKKSLADLTITDDTVQK